MQAFEQLFNIMAHAGILRTTYPNFRVGGRAFTACFSTGTEQELSQGRI
jgi:hypothetical protein